MDGAVLTEVKTFLVLYATTYITQNRPFIERRLWEPQDQAHNFWTISDATFEVVVDMCICVLELIMTVCIGFIHHFIIYFHRHCKSSNEVVSTALKKTITCILPMSVNLKQPNCSRIPGTIPVRLSKPVTD